MQDTSEHFRVWRDHCIWYWLWCYNHLGTRRCSQGLWRWSPCPCPSLSSRRCSRWMSMPNQSTEQTSTWTFHKFWFPEVEARLNHDVWKWQKEQEKSQQTHSEHLKAFWEDPGHQPVNVILVVHQGNHMLLPEVLQVLLVMQMQCAIRARPPLTQKGELWKQQPWPLTLDLIRSELLIDGAVLTAPMGIS